MFYCILTKLNNNKYPLCMKFLKDYKIMERIISIRVYIRSIWHVNSYYDKRLSVVTFEFMSFFISKNVHVNRSIHFSFFFNYNEI